VGIRQDVSKKIWKTAIDLRRKEEEKTSIQSFIEELRNSPQPNPMWDRVEREQTDLLV
jgi:hypothetical protein